MTFDTDERSISDSQPRDLYTFVLPAVTYRLTPGVRDMTYDGQTYKATTLSRGGLSVPVPDRALELEIPILVSHPVVQRYLQSGLPPSSMTVTVRRLQLTSGEAQLFWTGRVSSISIDRHVAKLIVPSRMTEAMQRRLPTLGVGRACPHVLYDARCTVSRNAFKVATTLVLNNGRDITVAGIGGKPDHWAQFGELVHVPSGEPMSVIDQLGTAIELHLPMIGMQAGDAVEIYAGCAHDILTCRDKFTNQPNYGGFPHLPDHNPHLPNGTGVVIQE